MSDIDTIIRMLLDRHPLVKIKQLQVKHAADDDGLWFLSHPESRSEVQLESPYGICPFLFESQGHDDRAYARTCDEAVMLIENGLGLNR